MTAEPKLKTIIIPLFLFAIAMGFLETAISIYIRDLYYPEGFSFPLKPVPLWHLVIEMAREVCTLIMLGAVAWISGNSSVRRFSSFLFIAGVGEISYYTGLWLSRGWPPSFLTWDIIFLVPVAWIGPVLAPLICSLVMIGMAAYFEWRRTSGKMHNFNLPGLLLVIAGAFIVIGSFVYDFSQIMFKNTYIAQFFSLTDDGDFIKDISSFIPDRFHWELFTFGMVVLLTGNHFAVDKIKLNKAR